MNELDSEKIAGELCHGGLQLVADPDQADVVILNTCSIREKAVQKVYARLGQLRRRKREDPVFLLGVVGCMPQLEGAQLIRRSPFVDFVAGPQKGARLLDLMEDRLRRGAPAIDLQMEDDAPPAETAHVVRENRWRAGVTISEGCSRRCAFCVVPHTRGRQRDRSGADVIREVEGLVAGGFLEVTLLGQTVTSYHDPDGRCRTFAALLRRLAGIDGLQRIRFTAPHPGDFSDELLRVMVSCPKVCNHIHLPLQAGSTRILRAMRRGYTRESYLRLIEKIREASRPIAVSTDIIVGFPGETDEDFRETLSLLDAARFDSVFSFKYSPRPNTAALLLSSEVPVEIQSARLGLLQEQQRLIQYNRNADYVGTTVQVLADGKAKTRFNLTGRTGENKIVNFDGPDDLLGTIVKVEVTGFSANSLKGAWKR